MLVCICLGITDKDIKNEIYEGAMSYREITQNLGVGTGCGQCGSFAKDLVKETMTELQLASSAMLGVEVKC